MLLRVNRFKRMATSTIGRFFVNGETACYSLERTDMIIPAGTYDLELYDSPKHGKDTIQLKDVPGRTNIQMHIANWARELLGCIALGTAIGNDMILHSGDACKKWFPPIVKALKAGERVTITIHED